MVIEGEWFDDTNLTDGATFKTAMIICAKKRFNQKIKFPCDIKRRIREISINNGCNTQIFQILRDIRDGNFLFNGDFLSRLPKSVELSHEWTKKNLIIRRTF